MNSKLKTEHPTKKRAVGLCLIFPSLELREQFKMSAMLQGESMSTAMLRMIREYIAKGPKVSVLARAINRKKSQERNTL